MPHLSSLPPFLLDTFTHHPIAATATALALTSATLSMFSKNFDPSRDIPDLTGKVALVTGGNTGLGYETILEFVNHGAKVYMAARSKDKAMAAIESLNKEVPGADIRWIQLDLASFDSVQSAAKSFLSQEDKLDLLINNAGVMALPHQHTKDGFEVQFGTNHMGHFLLTQLLLPALLRADAPRVVNLSSIGHNAAFRGIPFDKLDQPLSHTFERYGVAKLANLLHAKELNRRYPKLTAVSCHPGVIFSNLYDEYGKSGWLVKQAIAVSRKLWWWTPKMGAANQIWCATQEVRGGEYYVPVGVVGKPWRMEGISRFGRDRELARRLWEWSVKEVEKRGVEIDRGEVKV